MEKKTVIAASELHRSAGKVLKRVALDGERLVVERDGYPIAVILSYTEYEDIVRKQALENHKELVRKLNQIAEDQSLTEEQLLEEAQKDKREIYNKLYGSSDS
jgi:prevent-host-death family protein